MLFTDIGVQSLVLALNRSLTQSFICTPLIALYKESEIQRKAKTASKLGLPVSFLFVLVRVISWIARDAPQKAINEITRTNTNEIPRQIRIFDSLCRAWGFPTSCTKQGAQSSLSVASPQHFKCLSD